MDLESVHNFSQRKRDHIDLALRSENEALGGSLIDQVRLVHEALPELNFEDVQLTSQVLKLNTKPLLISSMTAGHVGSEDLNLLFAKAAQKNGWLFGVGSQRRELNDKSVVSEWKKIRESAPDAKILGNLGLSQLINTDVQQIEELVESLGACAMIIHLNALQECMQPEGTPNFKGGLAAIQNLATNLSVPVIVKETGCGFSQKTLLNLKETNVKAIDVSGFGGTHWGRIEGDRAANQNSQLKSDVAKTFKNWGISTVESMLSALDVNAKFEVWGSGGVRSGLDAAKLLAMGANCVGFAKPILQAALNGEDSLQQFMLKTEHELKVALFCTGSQTIEQLSSRRLWAWLP